MATFKQRLHEAVTFEEEVERFLMRREDIRLVVRCGTEQAFPELSELLKQRTDAASRFIRYTPDGIALPVKPEPFYWEAKCSDCMERDAYEAYCKLESIGCRVLLFLRTSECVSTCWASELSFIPSWQVVSKFAPDKQFPIKDGWIYPRQASNRCDLIFGSGTPYRRINTKRCDRLMDLSAWEQLVRLPSEAA
jgi:hypothetical protein